MYACAHYVVEGPRLSLGEGEFCDEHCTCSQISLGHPHSRADFHSASYKAGRYEQDGSLNWVIKARTRPSFAGNITLLEELVAQDADVGQKELITNIDYSATGGSRSAVALYNEQIRDVRSLTREFEIDFLNATGVPYDPAAAGISAPWFPCQNTTCQQLIQCVRR